MLHPLHHFLDQELEQVKASQKTYHKVKMEALHVVEKLSQVSGGWPQEVVWMRVSAIALCFGFVCEKASVIK